MLNELNERIIKKQEALIEALEVSNQKYDKYIATLEAARVEEQKLHKAEMAETTKLYSGAVAYVAAERDEAIALAEELKKDVQHWQAQFDREHNAFVQAAEERDQAIRDKEDLRRSLHTVHTELDVTKEYNDKLGKEGAQLFTDYAKALEFIDNICAMIACDAELSDIADECMLWRSGEWPPAAESIEDLVGGIIDEDPGSFFGGDSDTPVEDLVGAMEAEDQRRSDPNAPYRWKVLVVEHQGDEAVFTGWFADYDLARESVDLMVARGCYEAWVEELL